MMIITLCSWCEIVSPLVWTVSPGPWYTVTRWLGWAGLAGRCAVLLSPAQHNVANCPYEHFLVRDHKIMCQHPLKSKCLILKFLGQ